MKVVIVGNFWFPRGTASAARVRNLALGLRDCGARVHVMATAPHPPLDDDGGEHHGISYECVAPVRAAVNGWRDAEKTVPRLRRRFKDRLAWFGGLYAAAPVARRLLRDRMDRRACDLVVAYDRSLVRTTPLALLCRGRRVTSVLDVVEASASFRKRPLDPLYWDAVAGTRVAPRLFDGLSVITTGLAAAYEGAGCGPTLVLPALEDAPAPPAREPAPGEVFRLAYVGALQPRDAPEMLLATMRILAARAKVSLDVVGHYDDTEHGRRFARQCAEDETLRSAVVFRGSLSETALQERLAGMDGLLLTRRDAPAEVLSFPTRLVEHLRRGRPVFVSNVGDVSRYLRDGEEAALLDPHDPARAAGAIERVIARPDRGAEMGRRGREAGARAFDRKRHAARLLEFAAGLRRGEAA